MVFVFIKLNYCYNILCLAVDCIGLMPIIMTNIHTYTHTQEKCITSKYTIHWIDGTVLIIVFYRGRGTIWWPDCISSPVNNYVLWCEVMIIYWHFKDISKNFLLKKQVYIPNHGRITNVICQRYEWCSDNGLLFVGLKMRWQLSPVNLYLWTYLQRTDNIICIEMLGPKWGYISTMT